MQAWRTFLPLAGLAVVIPACDSPQPSEPMDAGFVEDGEFIIINGENTGVTHAQLPLVPLGCDPNRLPPIRAIICRVKRHLEGRRLFDQETFAGNGRTCLTCHSKKTGTFSPEEARQRLAADPNDPLFGHDGLDALGDPNSGTSRITEHATVLIQRSLPDGVVLADNRGATSVVVPRGVPTTVNTPGIDPVLMYDVRDPDLQRQARGAIHGHAQNEIEPTQLQLDLIAEFQRNDRRFYSSPRLRLFARVGGPEPRLPGGRTASERRGREFFIDAPFEPPDKTGVCALCHSGPLLNKPNEFMTDVFGAPPGWSAFTIDVSERNLMNNPVLRFEVTNPCGVTIVVESPDPGLLLTDPYNTSLGELLPPKELCVPELHPSFFANMFKTPQLRDVQNTAPYFHDNSAKTLEEVMEHYNFYFESLPAFQGIQLTDQEIQDIIAFMRLL